MPRGRTWRDGTRSEELAARRGSAQRREGRTAQDEKRRGAGHKVAQGSIKQARSGTAAKPQRQRQKHEGSGPEGGTAPARKAAERHRASRKGGRCGVRPARQGKERRREEVPVQCDERGTAPTETEDVTGSPPVGSSTEGQSLERRRGHRSQGRRGTGGRRRKADAVPAEGGGVRRRPGRGGSVESPAPAARRRRHSPSKESAVQSGPSRGRPTGRDRDLQRHSASREGGRGAAAGMEAVTRGGREGGSESKSEGATTPARAAAWDGSRPGVGGAKGHFPAGKGGHPAPEEGGAEAAGGLRGRERHTHTLLFYSRFSLRWPL